MLAGLFGCLLVTSANLFFFSTSLLTADDDDGDRLFTGDYKYDMQILVKNQTVAVGILGYGAVTSFIFIFVATMRNLGGSYNELSNKIRREKKGNR